MTTHHATPQAPKTSKQKNPEYLRELPPAEFSNALNELGVKLDNYHEWRKSDWWKMFVRGYNAAVNAANARIKGQYNMGQTASRLFGDERGC